MSTAPLIARLFLGIENKGNEALKNVRVMLEYNRRYHLNNELVKSICRFEPTVTESRYEPNSAYLIESNLNDSEIEKLLEFRKVSTFGDCAQIVYELRLIRPGERLMLSDLLLLKGQGPDDFNWFGFGDGGFQNVLAHIREIKNLKDYFIVHVSVLAENHEEFNSKVSVLRFSFGTDYDEVLRKFGSALWFGQRPKPGIYYTGGPGYAWLLRKLKSGGRLGQRIEKEELGILTFSEVAIVTTRDHRTFAMEVPEISQRQYFIISTPNCDYFNLPARVNDLETLMAWLGLSTQPLLPKKEKPAKVE